MARWKNLILAGFMALACPLEARAFDYVDRSLQVDQALPSVCLNFDTPLARGNGEAYQPFVTLDPASDHGLAVRGKDLCVTGLKHGVSYRIGLKPGLPDEDGDKLARAVAIAVTLPDREARVSFGQNQDILPYSAGAGLPLRSVNVASADIELYRIGERALADRMDDYWFGTTLSGYRAETLGQSAGALVFTGSVDIATKSNEEVITSLPIDRLLPTLQPGLYVMTAKPHGTTPDEWEDLATQWFSISDIGLFTAQGQDGMLVLARSLQSAAGMGDVALNLVAGNNEILGRFKTDADGKAFIPAGLLRGSGGNAPKLLSASMARGDFTYIPLDKPALDLSDLDVKGRTPPGPLDAFLWTDRGIYRPGETVRLQALLRNAQALPTDGLPLNLRLIRPDGIEAQSFKLDLASAGGGALDIPVPTSAYTGTWTVEADAGGMARIGEASFVVEDFVPPRLEVKATGPQAPPMAGQPIELAVDARYFYGAPAASLAGEARLTVEAADTPFPGLEAFSFGLVQEPFLPQQAEPASFTTDASGKALLQLEQPDLAETTRPLEAKASIDVFDMDGRPAKAEVTLPLHSAERFIGIRPAFEGTLPEQADAGFEVALVDATGQPATGGPLKYDLIRETWDYTWFRRDGRWQYERSVYDSRVGSGTVALNDQGRGSIKTPVTSGRWRIEVYDADGRTASSLRFGAGWWSDAESASDKPEVLPVTLDQDAPPDRIRAHIQPSFDAHVLVFTGEGKEQVTAFDIGKEGRTIEVPKGTIPAGGSYLVAVAFGRTGAVLPRLPVRALGTAWIAGDAAQRRLEVALQVPPRVQPDHPLPVDVAVQGLEPGKPAYLTVAAVDEAVLQMTAFTTPDPALHYLGRRALGLELRDVYGRLIDPAGQPGNIVSGGDARARLQIGNLDVKTFKTVALFKGPLAVDDSGHAHVDLDVPDFSGRLRVMAVVWSSDRFGAGQASSEVRPPLLAELSLPRFLAPGDKATLRASVTVLEAPEQSYDVQLSTEGPISFERTDIAFKDVKRDRRRFADRVLVAGNTPGQGRIVLTATGADGSRFERHFAISVRSPNSYMTTRQVQTLQPGQSLELNAALAANMLPGTAMGALTVSTLPAFDVPGLLAALRRYPYRCAEQTVSRAFPELYANLRQQDGAPAPDSGGTMSRLLSLQNQNGGFGLWSAHDDADLWLTSYVLDFLETAATHDVHVPEGMLDRTIGWLNARFSTLGSSPRELAGGSYAALVLARANRLDLSRLRYFALNALDSMPSEVARLQTAAALRRLGDQELAQRMMAGDPKPRPDGKVILADYGSELRDQAMALAIAAQEKLMPLDRLASLADETARGLARQSWLSTQEETWMLRASALMSGADTLDIELAGKKQTGIQSTSMDLKPETDAPRTLRNDGKAPIFAALSLTGVPQEAPPADANGFAIERQIFTREGSKADLSKVVQNQQLVVVISGSQDEKVARQALIVDMLPAGLEPETTNLPTSDSTSSLGWLNGLSSPTFTATRDDRFVAALDLGYGNGRFKLAYLVRAVTPGSFALPGVQVEDMYAPEFHARGPAGRLTVAPAPAP